MSAANISPTAVLAVAGVAAAAIAAMYVAKKGVAGAAQEAGGAIVTAADGAVTGVVKGIGERVGVPDTNQDQCTIDLANGDLWAASFSCPAPRYLAAVEKKIFGSGQSDPATGSW
jgi:hypothetical protein